MKTTLRIIPVALTLMLTSCKSNQCDINSETVEIKKDSTVADTAKFEYITEQFSDLRILRYEIPGFDQLSLQQKELLYYLSEAALCGRILSGIKIINLI